ncbi:MAG: DUF1211 domain-containing protein [Bacteroidetes bacterium]|nr:DUF1211 domain-containing protein [Bacteroidota bacterium]MBS1539581.1 DUF1211 domain-containing protein [Bacteroidota bacterium]
MFERNNNEKALARVESFSDSIFGFAITLLVLDLLSIPHFEIERNLAQSFQSHWQHFFAYLVGFCTILICWINHHHLFCYLIKYDGKFLWINGALLLIVTFTPFPTSLFSEFLLKENNAGLILFGLTYFLIACVAYLMWDYTHRNHFLDKGVNDSYYESILFLFRIAVFYNFIAFIVCFFSTPIAMIMYLVLFSVFAFPHYFTVHIYRHINKKCVRK